MQDRRRVNVEGVADMPVESQRCDGGEAVREQCALEGEEREEGGEVECVSCVDEGKRFGVAVCMYYLSGRLDAKGTASAHVHPPGHQRQIQQAAVRLLFPQKSPRPQALAVHAAQTRTRRAVFRPRRATPQEPKTPALADNVQRLAA